MVTTKRPRCRFSIPQRPRLSLSTQVVLGLVLGLVVGICVGDKAAVFQGIGKAFILLLQMTVLPYITLSLITGLGCLSYQDITTLTLKVGALLVGSWVLAFATARVAPRVPPCRPPAGARAASARPPGGRRPAPPGLVTAEGGADAQQPSLEASAYAVSVHRRP